MSQDPEQPQQPRALDELYRGLAAAQQQIDEHNQGMQEALPQLQSRRDELTARYEQSDDDQEKQQIDRELDELDAAIAAAREHLDDEDTDARDQDQERDGDGDGERERGRDAPSGAD